MAIIVWAAKWAPRRSDQSAGCASDYCSDWAADYRSANCASRSARSLDWSGTGAQGQRRQRYECDFVHAANLKKEFVDGVVRKLSCQSR